MDAFELGGLTVVAAMIIACCLAARASAGRQLSEFGRGHDRRRRAASQFGGSDEDDLREMLEVTNARRRARGLPERTVADAIREFGGG